MIRRRLAATDMDISVIGFGAFAMGGWMWGEQDDADSVAALHAALDAGVNWVDSAPIYGSGRSDRVLGEAIRALPPERRPFIFTKFGHHLVDGVRISDASRARVEADCDYALKAFGVERLDLFQLHWPAPQPVAETAEACARLLKAGKIRAVGLSNATPEQLAAWTATGVPLSAVQNHYNVFKTDAEAAILPWCAERQVGFLAYSPLMRGLLFGHWGPDKTFPAGDHRGGRPDFTQPRLGRYLQAVDELKAVAAEDDIPVAALAIGCLLCHEGMSACIVSARNAAQGAFLGELGLPARQAQLDLVAGICQRLQADLSKV